MDVFSVVSCPELMLLSDRMLSNLDPYLKSPQQHSIHNGMNIVLIVINSAIYHTRVRTLPY